MGKSYEDEKYKAKGDWSKGYSTYRALKRKKPLRDAAPANVKAAATTNPVTLVRKYRPKKTFQ